VPDLDAAYFVSKAATFEVVDGMFHVAVGIGPKASIEIVMPPNVFAECLRRAGRASDAFHAQSGEIVALRRPHAASRSKSPSATGTPRDINS